MPITVALPPRVRAVLYYAVFVLGVLVIVGTAIFCSLGGAWPIWFKAFAAGSAAFGSALGLTAATNTNLTPSLAQVTPVPAVLNGPPADEGETPEDAEPASDDELDKFADG